MGLNYFLYYKLYKMQKTRYNGYIRVTDGDYPWTRAT